MELRQGSSTCYPASHGCPFPEPHYLRRIMGSYFENVNEFYCQPAL